MNNQPKTLPAQYFFYCLVISAFISIGYPNAIFPTNIMTILGTITIFTGLLHVIWAIQLFKRNNTTYLFNQSNTLVVSGPYKYTRNPMYLGMLIFQVGICIIYNNPYTLLGPGIFYYFLNHHFIPWEEQKMKDTFGKDYTKYQKTTRRWI